MLASSSVKSVSSTDEEQTFQAVASRGLGGSRVVVLVKWPSNRLSFLIFTIGVYRDSSQVGCVCFSKRRLHIVPIMTLRGLQVVCRPFEGFYIVTMEMKTFLLNKQ